MLFWIFAFGVWITDDVLYKHKTEEREIVYQMYDIGAFGFAGDRIVELKPILDYWVYPKQIDTTTIDKENWILVE